MLGLGLSLVGTRHRVRLDDRGQTLWAWCAPDALLLPNQVSRHATVTSSRGVTGTQVALELDGGRVTAARRDQAVLLFMAVIDPADIRGSGCDQQNFFISADAASGRLAEHPGGFVLPVADAHALLVHLRGCRLAEGLATAARRSSRASEIEARRPQVGCHAATS